MVLTWASPLIALIRASAPFSISPTSVTLALRNQRSRTKAVGGVRPVGVVVACVWRNRG